MHWHPNCANALLHWASGTSCSEGHEAVGLGEPGVEVVLVAVRANLYVSWSLNRPLDLVD